MFFRKHILLLAGIGLSVCSLSAQSTRIQNVFPSSRVLNAHSTETLPARTMDIRIGHRFGTLSDGWETLYGLENVADVQIGVEYGITRDLMVGINRTKGTGPYRAMVHTFGKYRILAQTDDNKIPVSVALMAQASVSTMKANPDSTAINHFPKFGHRWQFSTQLMVSRRFGSWLSLQGNAWWLHRNYVNFADKNSVFVVGLAARAKITNSFALILDAAYPISDYRKPANGYYFPLGIGMEFNTGAGHVFQVNFTNAGGLSEPDFLLDSRADWLKGGFRLGFTISRHFMFKQKKKKDEVEENLLEF
jgi:hypothetical protein